MRPRPSLPSAPDLTKLWFWSIQNMGNSWETIFKLSKMMKMMKIWETCSKFGLRSIWSNLQKNYYWTDVPNKPNDWTDTWEPAESGTWWMIFFTAVLSDYKQKNDPMLSCLKTTQIHMYIIFYQYILHYIYTTRIFRNSWHCLVFGKLRIHQYGNKHMKLRNQIRNMIVPLSRGWDPFST